MSREVGEHTNQDAIESAVTPEELEKRIEEANRHDNADRQLGEPVEGALTEEEIKKRIEEAEQEAA